jgi:hypothetical protein
MTAHYPIPIEVFNIDAGYLFTIDGSYWDKRGWLHPKREDQITVLGKTRKITFKFSSESFGEMFFRPLDYFDKPKPQIYNDYMIRIELYK